ncbi:hypothetical protein KNZ07_04430 [Streptococcus dysgalactiae subsp. equisimilis]|nr:hypothetical protein KNZ01_17320 [Streptococcus dysgalactiae subsp. equisimilis]GET75950.1 hypothetical protein KNZ07_04430 [Streptococcus dysgalactiae subsp. equisimilis]GET78499.1 hypothetical protein KNZ10_10700 [Streptococcus dysgalactiae subsp. equisimilis]GET81052.1 hypothetical protein KNZ12_16920 [Streptococcus dysgalactiae subsp. equisimilis]GET83225.1 hypothetical protein KNZ15_19240 [Streptococcus dysgalactiae subsp. equisimilis]
MKAYLINTLAFSGMIKIMFMNISIIILIPKKNIDDSARFNQNQIESVLSPNKKPPAMWW